jgi:acyl-coenzyme A synthetase/AMP-(fatty) acid ligase
VKEFCVFAANFLWPARTMVGEKLVLVIHPEASVAVTNDLVAELAERNRRLLNYKRISGYLVWDRDFPLTASLKIKRGELADQIRGALERSAMVVL